MSTENDTFNALKKVSHDEMFLRWVNSDLVHSRDIIDQLQIDQFFATYGWTTTEYDRYCVKRGYTALWQLMKTRNE